MELLTLGIVLLGGGIAGGILRSVRRRRRLLWTKLAARLGGRYVDRSPIDAGHKGGILVERPGSERRAPVSIFVDFSRDDHGVRIRGHVRYPLPAGPIYHVATRGLRSSLVARLGPMQELVLGDNTAFDQRFFVECRAEDASIHATRQAWTSRAKALMLESLEGVTVNGRRHGITVAGSKDWVDTEQIEGIVALLEELGRVDFYGHRFLASLHMMSFAPARDLWGKPRPPMATTLVRGQEVAFCPRVDLGSRKAVMCAAVLNERGLPSFEAILGCKDESKPKPPAGIYTAATARFIDRLPGVTLSATPERLMVSFADRPVEAVDEALLKTAADLLAQLASANQGAFR